MDLWMKVVWCLICLVILVKIISYKNKCRISQIDYLRALAYDAGYFQASIENNRAVGFTIDDIKRWQIVKNNRIENLEDLQLIRQAFHDGFNDCQRGEKNFARNKLQEIGFEEWEQFDRESRVIDNLDGGAV
ncbi:hypothetical protein A2533_03970 [Candidatus Falkowbacteria bacterium RIFOXYD2_FULL_35_9]|uniref:Uncharacterized protein n=1 Tax=Candidatus Falkowbacteria bacterium RIFOXYC2_FULL_36_12 TaxID=1798002 RepID=A0A1F5SW10_9BACT|nr:MAG: hypothetical protein A2478_00495 [Candidatus Falkowbacteria bacterium RIFOXYC2_FULL_36_12]OGF33615.1 MAG: hypothetical protein A2223_03635 [Candidatus Falkowbacteria bacterium RIFOXYA2_FULL_35_8]OGF48149.1 MAG: hypothetical protein A2533_03970 [Candidatus Falkowbacteria bacterium RIFOXYD2_FULL_35_9]